MGKKNGRNDVTDLSRLNPLDAKDKKILRVVIETPKGSRNKFAFDPDQHVFHEREKKERLGLKGKKRAARAVSVAAAGASIGTIGLAAFALVVWKTIPNHSP